MNDKLHVDNLQQRLRLFQAASSVRVVRKEQGVEWPKATMGLETPSPLRWAWGGGRAFLIFCLDFFGIKIVGLVRFWCVLSRIFTFLRTSVLLRVESLHCSPTNQILYWAGHGAAVLRCFANKTSVRPVFVVSIALLTRKGGN